MKPFNILLFCILIAATAGAQGPNLSAYFPVPESLGGWRTGLPKDGGDPNRDTKDLILDRTGVDWDKLKEAWDFNTSAAGRTGLVVIRKGVIVGEWYRDCDRTTEFNIYSSSKSYLSTAFGLTLTDFGNGPLPDGRRLSLDAKVCNSDWIPESLPLTDPRKAEITVRQLLNMASGYSEENPAMDKPFEWSVGHVEGSPMVKLKSDPGAEFHYSNAGDAHLVLLFSHAQGEELFPFLKKRLLDPIGEHAVRWQEIGGKDGAIGPHAQGYSGIFTNPREHARFCYLALHKGEWAGKRVVPESYYDFAWTGTKVNPSYGGQWWVQPRIPGAPSDLVMTLGKDHNDGIVVRSLDLVAVRLGDGTTFPPDFEKTLVLKILAAIKK
jgi:CubicO group peptidase (beta-lactamase class C family)